MTAGALSLIHGNALGIPLADRSVHLIVSSPPYFALRDYRDEDEHFDGQLGSEETPHHFLAALWRVMDECWRVLRDDGSAWINLGDKFSGSGGNNNAGVGGSKRGPSRYNQSTGGLRPKSRMLLPHRFALGCQFPAYRQFEEAQAGLAPTADPPQWICRMDVVQSKLNGLPESVSDRVRASHESWFHLVKSERYFAAMDEIREEHLHGGAGLSWDERKALGQAMRHGDTGGGASAGAPGPKEGNPLGKLPGSVWEWANEPLVLPADLPQHFAAFASWPVRRIVLGWSPSGVCVACGQPRRPVCEKELEVDHIQRRTRGFMNAQRPGLGSLGVTNGSVNGSYRTTITGYACVCPPGVSPDAPTRPAVVLDPFSGTGTAPIVAAALGRHGVGVDLSWDYHRIARWRDADGGLRAKALGVDRPERQLPGQLSLLGDGQ